MGSYDVWVEQTVLDSAGGVSVRIESDEYDRDEAVSTRDCLVKIATDDDELYVHLSTLDPLTDALIRFQNEAEAAIELLKNPPPSPAPVSELLVVELTSDVGFAMAHSDARGVICAGKHIGYVERSIHKVGEWFASTSSYKAVGACSFQPTREAAIRFLIDRRSTTTGTAVPV